MREVIQLVSTAGTGFSYITTKNKRTSTGKLELNKYDPRAGRHVKFVEQKVSKSSRS
jgi:large subunit ribosomal protein L33